jgi:multidrug efflux pump subunit AcrA (membrane-fusion protein)
MFRTSLLLALALALAACSKGPGASQKDAGAKPAAAPILLSAEDVHTVRNSALSAGPAITGSIQPERRADLRAELPAIVLQVLKENGDTVRRGDLLVRLDDTAIRDSLASAEAANRAAGQAFEQAGRQLERM